MERLWQPSFSVFLCCLRSCGFSTPVCLLEERFGLIVTTVFQMILTLGRYIGFVMFLMVSFGVSLVLLLGTDRLEAIVRNAKLDSSDEERSLVFRFLYVTFMMTFEGQGVNELIDRGYDKDDNLLFFVSMVFRIAVVLGAMQLVIGVMVGEWSRNEPLSRGLCPRFFLAQS